MKTIKSIILIFAIFICMSFLCSCGTKEVVGPQGPQGEQGIQGEKGEQGQPGKDGVDGQNGVNGKDGTSLLTGNGEPTSVIGIVGDSYIDLDTWSFYIKTTNGWVISGNIKGEKGDSAAADHDGTEGIEFYPINDTECAVSAGNAKLLKEIVIPSKYKNYTVTIINGKFVGEGFANCTNLEKIIIPDSITTIDSLAFSGCSSLTSITIPSSVTRIGDDAFNACFSLESIVIPDSVTSIGQQAFSFCSSLTIYCEVSSKPSGWNSSFYLFDGSVYWAGEWEYDADGNPIPLN